MVSDFLSQEEIDALLGKSEPAQEEPKPEKPSPGRKGPKREAPPEEESPDNLDLILDFPLKISVRLGDVTKSLQELRQIGPGQVFELDRFVSDPVDVFVNGKLIARGEVVVVDENFGIRINQILSPVERVKKLR